MWSAAHSAADTLLENERNTIDVFKKSSPNVVYVNRMSTVKHGQVAAPTAVQSGTGSGIIWDKSGNVVTNFHVIHGGDSFTVTIGSKTFPAKVIGVEPRKDLAVLRVHAPKTVELFSKVIPFEIAHTNNLLVGQKAMAIGNPFGLGHSLTIGVISALGRSVPGIGAVTIHDMIQTDAAINPGNSGGPLLDSNGRLIGLNTVIYSQSGSSAGVGFAVPADDIEHTVNQIIQKGHVQLSGIGIQPVEPKLARRLGVQSGILIAQVLHKTPAESAKLRSTSRDVWGQYHVGDVIVGLNGHKVENYDVLYNLLDKIRIGAPITLTVVRNHQYIYHKMHTIDISSVG